MTGLDLTTSLLSTRNTRRVANLSQVLSYLATHVSHVAALLYVVTPSDMQCH